MEDQEKLSTSGESAEPEDIPDMSTSHAFASRREDGEDRVIGVQTSAMSLQDLHGTDMFGLNESTETQSSNVPAMKNVRKMMQPEHMTQGDTQIQDLSSPQPFRSTASPTKRVGGMEYQNLDVVRCQCGSEAVDDAMVSSQLICVAVGC
jgi:hypothetical protein